MIKTNEFFPDKVHHPGIDLNEKLEELEMGPKEFAIRTGKPEKTITAILNGDSSVTADMAVLFENVLKIPAHFWMNRQRSYDEYKARLKKRADLFEAWEWAKQFPLSEMMKKGWIPVVTTQEDKAEKLLYFFSFSNPEAWEDYYCKSKLKVSFRISLKHAKEPYAMSAWLRKGEIDAAGLKVGSYSETLFKQNLQKIKDLMANHPANYFEQLQNMCMEAGVKVVYTPFLPKAPINGATRWLNDTPLIQLSARYRRNDVFWFTFFHEAGHILLHGKKDIFIESTDYSAHDPVKEKEADDFAVKWTLTPEQETEILNTKPLYEKDVLSFAEKFNTHPAIIIGRLQHKGLLHPSVGRRFLIHIQLDN